MKSGEWTNFFTAIPANSSLIQSVKPIGFRVQDFKGQNVKVSNRLQYELVECETKPSKNVKIQVLDVYKSAEVFIKTSGSITFSSFASLGEETSPIYDITPYLTDGDNDEIRISNAAARSWFFGKKRRKVRLIILINNNKVYDDTN